MGRYGAGLLRDVAEIAVLAVVDGEEMGFSQVSVEEAVLENGDIGIVQAQKAGVGLVGLDRDEGQGRDAGEFGLFDDEAEFTFGDALTGGDAAQAGAGAEGQRVKTAGGFVRGHDAGAAGFGQAQEAQFHRSDGREGFVGATPFAGVADSAANTASAL